MSLNSQDYIHRTILDYRGLCLGSRDYPGLLRTIPGEQGLPWTTEDYTWGAGTTLDYRGLCLESWTTRDHSLPGDYLGLSWTTRD